MSDYGNCDECGLASYGPAPAVDDVFVCWDCVAPPFFTRSGPWQWRGCTCVGTDEATVFVSRIGSFEFRHDYIPADRALSDWLKRGACCTAQDAL